MRRGTIAQRISIRCPTTFPDCSIGTRLSNPTIIVKTLDDDPSGCPDKCTLRSAIDTAKSGDVIGFDPSLKGSIILVQTLIIDKDLTFIGPGADKLALNGNNMVGVLHINEAIRFNLSGLTIKNGNADSGGGIYNRGNLTITDCTISHNKAGNGGGGGILGFGSVTITNSIISGNSSGYFGGGIFGQGTITNSTISDNTASREGGGIQGQWTITDSTISGNSAYMGGGVYNNGGSIINSTISHNNAHSGGGVMNGGTISNSTISNNTASNGGGVMNGGTISNSLIAGNAASDKGGGVWSGSGTITNSTLHGNRAKYGGGLWSDGYAGNGIVLNSTIYDNTASTEGGGIAGETTVTLGSSIVAGNSSKGDGSDILATLKSLGKNLIGNSKGVTGLFASDQKDVDPLFMPLAVNEPGTTKTLALKPGSPAIGKGKCDFTPPVTTDQRGVARKSECDVGAYETDGK